MRVHSLKQKPYALVEFESSECAIDAYQKIDGRFSEEIGKIIVLDYWRVEESQVEGHTVDPKMVRIAS